ncbi:hypothetical protein H4O18_15185 [Arenibacter sp. BSSL-BM3]|uniref:DoxX-like family protein n=1 Tax=Arenibacter arenosicollis TaxID=2762274 RepID=A0ABR7QQ81_9FLAO|nr:hypothetical protein [Arenibacter arenosicollis]MBC8769340.1 hypothetical protein [Arenibacter arenosicollis]
MTLIAKFIVILFGVYLIAVGFLMLLYPKKAREYLRMAGSTNIINYAELTIRIIPASALILYAEISKYPVVFEVLGWFMIATSIVLYFVPRKIHHNYALWCAKILKTIYIRCISPFSILFGILLIYATM